MYIYMLTVYWVSFNVYICICSVGEVGWRLRPGDDTPHTTLGTGTLQLLSTGDTGDTGDTVDTGDAPPNAHAATLHVHAQVTTAAKDSNEGEEKESPETVGVELEEVDIGQNQSTSTLVNEDSVLTPTQSSSSVSALTLTEISQREGTQSTGQLKKDEHTHLDKPLNEPTATNEATSQLSLKLDECAHGDKPLNKLPTTTEGTCQLLADKKAAGNGDSVDGGDGGGVKREERREVKEEGVESSEGLDRIVADSHQSPGPDTKMVIGDIVRSEMKKILEVYNTCTCS